MDTEGGTDVSPSACLGSNRCIFRNFEHGLNGGDDIVEFVADEVEVVNIDDLHAPC